MDLPVEPIKKTSISKMIQSQLVEMIRTGVIQPGAKLHSERDLCDRFCVSRTSLREAIGGLEAMGVLKKCSDGIYACENLSTIIYNPLNLLVKLQNVSFDELIEARIATESQIIAIATMKAAPQDLEKLEQIIELAEKAATEEECCYQAARFHRTLAELTYNSILICMFSVLYDILTEKRTGEYFKSSSYHRVLLDYMKKKDALGSAEAMKQHIKSIKEYTD